VDLEAAVRPDLEIGGVEMPALAGVPGARDAARLRREIQ
jgi:hypothetical protein